MLKKILGVIVVLALILSAIGGAIGVSEVGAKKEKHVVVGFQEPIKGLNPHDPAFNDVWCAFIRNGMWDSVYRWGADYDLIPWMAAERAKYEERDGKIIATATLKSAKWWDGKPVTAEDVAFSHNIVLNYRLPLYYSDWVIGEEPYLVKAEAIDEKTVQWTLTQKTIAFEIALGDIPILPKHQWEPVVEKAKSEGKTPEEISMAIQNFKVIIDDVVGCGPFKPVDWKRGSYIKLETNKDYFMRGKVIHAKAGDFKVGPWVDGILVKIYRDLDALTMAVLKGEIDHPKWNLDAGRIMDFAENPNTKVATSDDCGYFYLAFNLRKPPLDDPAFRKAFATLVQKEFIVERLLQGYGSGLYIPVPPGNTYYYNPNTARYGEGLTKDERIERAKQILGNAGYSWDKSGGLIMPNGKPMPAMTILTPPADYDPVRAMAGMLIQEWVKEVGMPITAKPTSFGTIVDEVWPPEGLPDFDLYILGWSLGFDAAESARGIFHSSQRPEVIPGGNNAPGYNSSKFDHYIELSAVTMNPEARQKYIFKAMETLAEDLPYVCLYGRKLIEVYRTDNFKNWWVRPLGGIGQASPYNWETWMCLEPV